MSNLTQHAEYELRRAGLFDADSDYGGAVGNAVMRLVEAFAGDGHSGFSAMMTLDVFDRVARYKTLTPISSDPGEWSDVGTGFSGHPLWQNRRQSSCFSLNGGKSWYDIDAPDAAEQRAKHEAEVQSPNV